MIFHDAMSGRGISTGVAIPGDPRKARRRMKPKPPNDGLTARERARRKRDEAKDGERAEGEA